MKLRIAALSLVTIAISAIHQPLLAEEKVETEKNRLLPEVTAEIVVTAKRAQAEQLTADTEVLLLADAQGQILEDLNARLVGTSYHTEAFQD